MAPSKALKKHAVACNRGEKNRRRGAGRSPPIPPLEPAYFAQSFNEFRKIFTLAIRDHTASRTFFDYAGFCPAHPKGENRGRFSPCRTGYTGSGLAPLALPDPARVWQGKKTAYE
jgi:hypothetical protein